MTIARMTNTAYGCDATAQRVKAAWHVNYAAWQRRAEAVQVTGRLGELWAEAVAVEEEYSRPFSMASFKEQAAFHERTSDHGRVWRRTARVRECTASRVRT